MFLKLIPSSLDKKYLALRSKKTTPIAADFSKLAVNKPWGREYLLFKNSAVEVWHLNIKQHKATSMHCHPKKRTTLVVLAGRALFSSLNRSLELKPRDAIVIERGVFHSTQALSKNGASVLEFENPPMKHDLIRLEDKYGRLNKGYEGLKNMFRINGAYCRFSENEVGTAKELSDNKLCIHRINGRRDFQSIVTDPFSIFIILNGTVFDIEGKKLFQTTDIATAQSLLSRGNSFNDVFVLAIHPPKNA